MATKKSRLGFPIKRRRKAPAFGSKQALIAHIVSDMPKNRPAQIREASRRLSELSVPQLQRLLERKQQKTGRSVSFRFLQSTSKSKDARYPWSFRILSSVYPKGYHYDLQSGWHPLGIYGPELPASATNEELAHAAGILAKKFGFTKRDYPVRYMQAKRRSAKDWSPYQEIMRHKRRS